MNTEEFLGGQLARAHIRRSRLREEIDHLNAELHKRMRLIGAVDAKIWELRRLIQRTDEGRPRA